MLTEEQDASENARRARAAEKDLEDAIPSNRRMLLRNRSGETSETTKANSIEEMDELLAHLRAAFLSIGYTHAHTVEAMVRSWHEVFARAGLHRREAAMIRGLAQQILWSAQYVPDEVRPRPRVS